MHQTEIESMKVVRFYVWNGLCWRGRVVMGLLTLAWVVKLCAR